jgi:hypothetical protein
MYRKPPSAQDLQALNFLGISDDDYGEDSWKRDVEVFPDNWRVIEFMDAIGGGAWNMGPGGPTGLKPESFREGRFTLAITRAEWPELLADLRVFESAALDEIHKD